MTIKQPKKCRICNGSDCPVMLDFGPRPITKRLLSLPQSENEFSQDIRLHICRDCGFVQILDTVPENELYSEYALQSTWKSQPHLLDELNELRRLGSLSNDDFIVEIGCNDGSALMSLRNQGAVNLLGVEPSSDVASIAQSRGFTVFNGYFNSSLAKDIQGKYGKCDLLICRQVLEHVSYLDEFLTAVRSIINDNGNLLIEVPDFAVPLEYGDISAIWEEHVNYFTENSLKYLLRKHGFDPVLTRRYDFSGGAITVIARKASAEESIFVGNILSEYDVNSLYRKKTEDFASRIIMYITASGYPKDRIAIYGAGNRSVILLNHFLDNFVGIVVDDQPEKQNRFLPKCHKPIYGSEYLINNNIALCLLAVNAENEDVVINNNLEYTRKGGKFVSVLSPSKYLIFNGDQING